MERNISQLQVENWEKVVTLTQLLQGQLNVSLWIWQDPAFLLHQSLSIIAGNPEPSQDKILYMTLYIIMA